MDAAQARPPTAGRRRRRPRLMPAAVLGTAAALALPLAASAPGAASAPPPRVTASPSATPAGTVVVVDCFAKPQVRPADFLLACGDGNNRLTDLHWTGWGRQTATATGTDMVNDCVPYCAAGKFRAYPVTVTLSVPRPWPSQPGTPHFTKLRIVYTDTAPAPLPHEVTYDLWN
ncbi:hypothetical protein [Streptomyces sp. NPDC093225]|uniref:hypothetical protein n=1 Tax=Streptomyces sp. NPDC093225 TaxID=3366034 RepID=UPI00382812D9